MRLWPVAHGQEEASDDGALVDTLHKDVGDVDATEFEPGILERSGEDLRRAKSGGVSSSRAGKGEVPQLTMKKIQ